MRSVSLVTTSGAVIWCIIVFLLPDAVGSRVLGATWQEAKPLLPLVALVMVGLATSMGPTQGMLALGAARRSLFTQVAALAVSLPLTVVGAILAGARGAAMLMAVTSVFRTTLAWVQFRRALSDHSPSGEPESPAQALEVARVS
jgi:O-antigen/teichoic acid export membrane protein